MHSSFPPAQHVFSLLSVISYTNYCTSDGIGTFAQEGFSRCVELAALTAARQAWFLVIVLASGGQNYLFYSFMGELSSDD